MNSILCFVFGVLFILTAFPLAAVGSNAKDKSFFKTLILISFCFGLILISSGIYLLLA